MKYGTVKCLKETSLSVWDGSGNKETINPDEILDITYHEQNGCLGITNAKGVELCLTSVRRENFLETWEKTI